MGTRIMLRIAPPEIYECYILPYITLFGRDRCHDHRIDHLIDHEPAC